MYLSYLWTYELYGTVRNGFDAGKSTARASGMWLGPGTEIFWGPVKWHQAVRRVPFGAKIVVSRGWGCAVCIGGGGGDSSDITGELVGGGGLTVISQLTVLSVLLSLLVRIQLYSYLPSIQQCSKLSLPHCQ